MTQDEKEQHKGISPATAALTGLAIGAAAGVVATAMSNKDTRKKVLTKADEMGQKAEDTYNKATTKASKTWENIQPKLRKTNEQAKNVQVEAEKQVEELATKGGEVLHTAEDKTKNQSGKNSL